MTKYSIEFDDSKKIVKVKQHDDIGSVLISSYGSMKEFTDSFAMNASMKTPIMSNAIQFAKTPDKLTVNMVFPAKRVEFKRQRYGHSLEKYDVYVPDIMMSVDMYPHKGTNRVSEVSMYCLQSKIVNPDTILYVPPFANVYQNCRICFGSVALPAYPVENIMGASAVYDWFFNNVANDDLYRPKDYKSEILNKQVHLGTHGDFLNYMNGLDEEKSREVYFSQETFGTYAKVML